MATGASPIQPAPGLVVQTVVVIGGSGGSGLETARRALFGTFFRSIPI